MCTITKSMLGMFKTQKRTNALTMGCTSIWWSEYCDQSGDKHPQEIDISQGGNIEGREMPNQKKWR